MSVFALLSRPTHHHAVFCACRLIKWVCSVLDLTIVGHTPWCTWFDRCFTISFSSLLPFPMPGDPDTRKMTHCRSQAVACDFNFFSFLFSHVCPALEFFGSAGAIHLHPPLSSHTHTACICARTLSRSQVRARAVPELPVEISPTGWCG
jgi:hypothetical protein